MFVWGGVVRIKGCFEEEGGWWVEVWLEVGGSLGGGGNEVWLEEFGR